MDFLKYSCPYLFSTAALITTLVFGFWCRSFSFEGNDYEVTIGTVDVTVRAGDLHFSPWFMLKTDIDNAYISDGTVYIYTRDECVEWGSDEDTKWNFVKAITIITPIVGGILTLMLCATPCATDLIAKAWHCMAVFYIVVLTLFQGLAFLIFRSDACEDNPKVQQLEDSIAERVNQYASEAQLTGEAIEIDHGSLWKDECSWDKGSSLNIVAIACWFVAGAIMLVMGAPSTTSDNGEAEEPFPADSDEKQNEKREQPASEEDPGNTHQGEEDIKAENDSGDD